MKNMNKIRNCLIGVFSLLFLNFNAFADNPVTLPGQPNTGINQITLQPNINLPLTTDNQSNRYAAMQCQQQQCCLYNNSFYSEGAVISVANNLVLQCMRDPNVAGANALRWSALNLTN